MTPALPPLPAKPFGGAVEALRRLHAPQAVVDTQWQFGDWTSLAAVGGQNQRTVQHIHAATQTLA